ncbi:MAG: penicillin-binding protein 2 [Patescibacteria group bacterium]
MSVNFTGRVRLLSLIIFIMILVLVSRLFFLQLIKNNFYADKADRQYQRPAGQLSDRGTIFFKQQNAQLVSAATMRDGFILALNPTLISSASPDLENIYSKLVNILPELDHESFIAKASKSTDPYEEIATRLDQATADKIKSLKLSGVNLYKTRWRFYPAGATAAHALGFLNYEGVGSYGLEKQYESLLKRESDKTFVSFLSEVLSDFGGSLWGKAVNTSEADIVTSIESTVQETLEQELALIKSKWQSETVGGIILDPHTGAVLAMAALPDFDPGGKKDNLNILANPLVERVYEMGSIFKPLTMAAALDAGVVKPSTTYFDAGTLMLNNKTINNFDFKSRGTVSMQEVLNQSLNTGAVFAMQKLGRIKFSEYMFKYGLAEKTNIDLPGEVNNLITNLNSTRDIEYATAAFGQGLAVTPITMARALAVLGNGGVLVKPHVVTEISRNNSKLTQVIKPEIIRQVLKPETSKTITQMLVTVVDTALLGGQHKNERYSVAAKTGTAQQVRPGANSYDPDYFLHSFFGYFPASNPRFLVFLYQLHPQGAPYASATLTEPFMKLTKFLLNYYNVPPDR